MLHRVSVFDETLKIWKIFTKCILDKIPLIIKKEILRESPLSNKFVLRPISSFPFPFESSGRDGPLDGGTRGRRERRKARTMMHGESRLARDWRRVPDGSKLAVKCSRPVHFPLFRVSKDTSAILSGKLSDAFRLSSHALSQLNDASRIHKQM